VPVYNVYNITIGIFIIKKDISDFLSWILQKEKIITNNMTNKIAGITNQFDFVKFMSYKFLFFILKIFIYFYTKVIFLKYYYFFIISHLLFNLIKLY